MTPTEQHMDGANGTYQVCGPCGRGFGLDFKKVMGMWSGTCDICGEKKAVANALHDFGLSDGEVAEIRERTGAQ